VSINYATVSAVIPRIVRDALANDADLAAFFEQIALAEQYQVEGPIRTPALLVVPGTLEQSRQVGGEAEGTYTVSVAAVLPVPTPFRYDLAAPSAPTSAFTATGPLTGTYVYRVTQFSADGESAASPPLTVAPSAQWVTLTKPTLASGALGWRIWRGKAGKTALHHVVTLRADVTSWKDTVPDTGLADELAPIPFYAEALLDHAAKVLYAVETLTDSGSRYASAAMSCQQGRDEVATNRNLRVRELVVTVPTYINTTDSTVITGSV